MIFAALRRRRTAAVIRAASLTQAPTSPGMLEVGPVPTQGSQAETAEVERVAVLPYRFDGQGNVEVMLIASRTSRQRWTLPHAPLISGLPAQEIAAREAFAEAGVIGRVAGQPMGGYRAQTKDEGRIAGKSPVTVFSLRVEKRSRDWPQKENRTALWFEPCLAAKAVREPALARLIADFLPQHEGAVA